MDFRLEFNPQPASDKVNIDDKIMLMGSCFTEHIHTKLDYYKFTTLQNPSGTLFNPISIFNSIQCYSTGNPVIETDLVWHHGLWNHWDFHSSLSSNSKEDVLNKINERISTAHHFLRSTKQLIITLGSAFVYELDQHRIVANCHKFPATAFRKRLLEPEEIIASFEATVQLLNDVNPNIKLIATVSPVRHLRDGFVENNRSKSVLIYALSKLMQRHPISYFPSYELVIDDLRDYRFFAEDMVHPNYQATRYVWEKFVTGYIDGRTREFMKEYDQVLNAMQHKVQHPGSEEYIKFKTKFYALSLQLSQRFPRLDFAKELEYFKN